MIANNAESFALEALSRALGDPTPMPLHGTAARPGILKGASQKAKAAASLCLEHAWLEPTGETVGKGKSRKDLYRITARGIQHVLAHGEPVTTLRDLLATLGGQERLLRRLVDEVSGAAALLERHREVVTALQDRLEPPDVADVFARMQRTTRSPQTAKGPEPASLDWLREIESHIDAYARKHSHGLCPLPELFRAVAEPHKLTIGQFHDGIRRLVAEKRVALHPFTGSRYELTDERYALLSGQEIKYYAARARR